MGSGRQVNLTGSADAGAAPAEEVAARVERLLTEPLAARGTQLLEVQFRHEGRWVLRLMIDREQGVNLEDCGAVSELAGRILDVEDPIELPFVLEVTSPGMFRALREPKHFRQSVGKLVRLTLAPGVLPERGERLVRGVLESVQEHQITLREAPKSQRAAPTSLRARPTTPGEAQGAITLPLAGVKTARLDPDPWAGQQATEPQAKGAGRKTRGREQDPQD